MPYNFSHFWTYSVRCESQVWATAFKQRERRFFKKFLLLLLLRQTRCMFWCLIFPSGEGCFYFSSPALSVQGLEIYMLPSRVECLFHSTWKASLMDLFRTGNAEHVRELTTSYSKDMRVFSIWSFKSSFPAIESSECAIQMGFYKSRQI